MISSKSIDKQGSLGCLIIRNTSGWPENPSRVLTSALGEMKK